MDRITHDSKGNELPEIYVFHTKESLVPKTVVPYVAQEILSCWDTDISYRFSPDGFEQPHLIIDEEDLPDLGKPETGYVLALDYLVALSKADLYEKIAQYFGHKMRLDRSNSLHAAQLCLLAKLEEQGVLPEKK